MRPLGRVVSEPQMTLTYIDIHMFLAEATAVASVEPWRNRVFADNRTGCDPALPGRRAS